MNWKDIETYIRAIAPEGFMDGCKGVPREHVVECEQQLGIELPCMYVDFLLAMGTGSPGYSPFGGQHDHDFYVLLENLVHAKYPRWRYFRVGYQVDDVDVIEPCLDLVGAADGDTPLVEIPGDMPFFPEYVRSLHKSLAEGLVSAAFLHFGMTRSHVRVLSLHDEDPAVVLDAHRQAVGILRRMDLQPELSPSPFLTCMGVEPVASVDNCSADRTFMTLTLAGYEVGEIPRLAEILIDALPGLEDETFSRAWAWVQEP